MRMSSYVLLLSKDNMNLVVMPVQITGNIRIDHRDHRSVFRVRKHCMDELPVWSQTASASDEINLSFAVSRPV